MTLKYIKMKIDFIINSLAGGGAERVMVTLAHGFSKFNDISIITFNNKTAYEVASEVTRVKLHQGRSKNHTLRSWRNLFNHYKKKINRPDYTIVFMPENALIAIPIAKLFGIKIIVSEHNNHKAYPYFKSKWSRKLLYPKANAVTVLTSYDIDFYSKLNRQVVVMPNPIILPKEINTFSKRKKNIFAAGSMKKIDVKGFESLLKIAAPILKKHSDWTLTIAGGGGNGIEILDTLRKQLHIENQVILPGFCNNIQELMQESQIFALPSKFEGLPMVLMEALSNGMCCIAYDCVSGPRDLIENGKNGLLIENQNADAFEKELERLVADDELRTNLAANAPKSVKDYDLPSIMAKWKRLFNQLDA
jgi:GalNAc-alpha-(1->4)-GalNAc-alpha-(1->3)-diNAcBac-PP-undecaprenol alpha-1,4-N-acetyl-D-galactosaminyltransferase